MLQRVFTGRLATGLATSSDALTSVYPCAVLNRIQHELTCSLSLDVYINLLARLPSLPVHTFHPVFLPKTMELRVMGASLLLFQNPQSPELCLRLRAFPRHILQNPRRRCNGISALGALHKSKDGALHRMTGGS